MTSRAHIRRRSLRAALLTAVLIATMPAAGALADAGDLDPAFGDGGRQVLAENGNPEATLVQPDGRIVVVSSYPATDIVVRRLMPDGSPDRSFDGDGTAVADLGGTEQTFAATLQSDGAIVVAGTSSVGVTDRGAVARFTPAGKLDPAFSPGGAEGDGRALLSSMARAHAVLTQADGRIVVAGDAYGFWSVTRLTAAGAPDGTMYDPVGFGAPGREFIRGIAPLAGGGIAVGGSTESGEQPARGVVAAFGADGKLVPQFGTGGKKAFEPSELLRAETLLPRAGGGLVVAGTADAADPRSHVLALDPKGAVDRNFGAGGVAAVDFTGRDTFGGAVRDPDGRILVAGTVGLAEAMSVARLTPAGDIDAGFGTGGQVTFPFGLRTIASSAAVQPDGALVVAGETQVDATTVRTGVARLLGDPPPATGGDPGPGPGAGGPDPGPGGDPGTPPPPAPLCGGRPATIVGTAAAEILRGTPGADVIVARGGRDRVLGGGGADRICGGGGRDSLVGSGGRDRLLGGAAADRLDGGRARDRCRGGAGRDRTRRCER